MMLHESLRQAIKLVRVAAQEKKINTTVMLIGVGVARLVDKLDRAPNRAALQTLERENLQGTLNRIKSTVAGTPDVQFGKLMTGEAGVNLARYMDVVERKLNSLYDELINDHRGR